jgi:hypothetical protein
MGEVVIVWPGFESAMRALTNDCAKALGAKDSESAKARLNAAPIAASESLPFTVDPCKISSNGSYTCGFRGDFGFTGQGGIILLNAKVLGSTNNYDTGQKLPDGSTAIIDIIAAMASGWGLKYNEPGGISNEDFWGIYLLHELGHIMSGLPNDALNPKLSNDNTQKVIDNCYKHLKN